MELRAVNGDPVGIGDQQSGARAEHFNATLNCARRSADDFVDDQAGKIAPGKIGIMFDDSAEEAVTRQKTVVDDESRLTDVERVELICADAVFVRFGDIHNRCSVGGGAY